jgi:crotonobetainyl-CoA:carnitine CoA-transferase CaiB-like acyl-CoA transferase
MARERRMVRDAQLTAGSDETALTLGTAIRIDGRPRPTGTPPPELGADTRALAREVGLTDEQIEALMARGVLRSDGAA